MFCGLVTIVAVWKFSSVAYTWYVLIGAGVTLLLGALVSRIFTKDTMQFEPSAQAELKQEIG
jgi:sensor histidine kinase regulating citrate/malate metabolism